MMYYRKSSFGRPHMQLQGVSKPDQIKRSFSKERTRKIVTVDILIFNTPQKYLVQKS